MSVLFIFRRDLRIEDNTALNEAANRFGKVYTAFFFDPAQVEIHPYRSEPGLRFMLESLEELDASIQGRGGRISYFYGSAQELLPDTIKRNSISAVFVNSDYTPFAIKRDAGLKEMLEEIGCEFRAIDDLLLNSPHRVLKDNKKPYTVFTPYWKKAIQNPVAKPETVARLIFEKELEGAVELKSVVSKIVANPPKEPFLRGGRSEGLKLLKSAEDLSDYKRRRDIPAIKGTSGLSAHNKFGTLSIREVYWSLSESLGSGNELLRQLYWRDFFTQIGFHFPHVFGAAFNPPYDKVEWRNDLELFELWRQGMTGFPIVDAGMRELNATGYMHNRARMIVASFLTKDLHIDWRWGERYFATKLVDYDPAVNNGSWQWAASTGCDAQPYFRVFNPWLQQEKFDGSCEYIKRWVPELRGLETKVIHDWAEKAHAGIKYPRPIVNHSEERKLTEILYKRALTR